MTNDPQALLSIRGLVKRYGGLLVTDHVDLDILPGEVHAIIGPNGAGKTTLISQIVGEVPSDAGSLHLAGRPIDALGVAERARAGIGRSYQITSVIPQFTVLDNVLLAVQGCRGHAYRFWQPAYKNVELFARADEIIELIGLAARRDTPAAALAYGQQRQLEVAMALAMEPKVLLLDEPMAGMGHGESAMMVALLQRLKGRYGILLIEHDMDAVFSLADRISVLFYGKVIYCGDPAAVKDTPQVREAYLGDEEVPA
ncbi:ABC transporter ATP-binding protein [Alicycliphilus denitrificans]|uniref:ABC transporter ATP-binding protein n=1 Tax=Alicycliphilus denitrificans TaxID=179636 RepID=A0A420KFQ9_9BURK|nr:ABC transporter ATP-binding protein [Alicycliphilus denitrificans]RKJ98770.1 ABC transporter ATP-binding protein [Alicycliphilus denitrificans]